MRSINILFQTKGCILWQICISVLHLLFWVMRCN